MVPPLIASRWRTFPIGTLPILGGVLLFLEVWPPPVFGLDLESLRILSQFPLLAVATIATLERRSRWALASALPLALLQCLPSFVRLTSGAEAGIDPLLVPLLWSAQGIAALKRSGAYLGGTAPTEETP